jgi:diguanylate cyclase (GGDEF)-like protein
MHVSFRNRLTLFFILLVILPVLAVAAVAILIVRDSEDGRTEARLEQAVKSAQAVYGEARAEAEASAMTIQGDRGLAAALRSGNEALAARRLQALADRTGAVRIRLVFPGRPPLEAGGGEAVAPARTRVVDAQRRLQGRMVLSTTTADDYTRTVADGTGLDVLLSEGDDLLAGTVEATAVRSLPLDGDVDLDGQDYVVSGFRTPGFDAAPLTVRLLTTKDEANDAASENTLRVVLILLAFLICALAFALTAARSLQSQINRLLDAARTLGRGDFSVEVPTEGNDEFAALGREFNDMARELESRLEELQLERARLQETVRRVGESVGKGLDRDALLGIVVQTAVDGVAAECGRVVMRQAGNGTLVEAARSGELDGYMAAVQAAEAAALELGEVAETQISGATALARPLQAPDPAQGVLGVFSIARPGPPFTERQRELFAYLTSQAVISLENVDLHETIQRQAVTDELTGLFNHRRFQEVITTEVERTRRFDHELGLVMFDIDDFKLVNDTYGHLQGDQVLREVARVLRESSREIDEPARYGGEEMAVALPQTGLQGAYEFAERVRQRIASLDLPRVDGEGTLRVTASFGVAALPHSSRRDKDALVAAADAALYRAKRSGKNCTVKAE